MIGLRERKMAGLLGSLGLAIGTSVTPLAQVPASSTAPARRAPALTLVEVSQPERSVAGARGEIAFLLWVDSQDSQSFAASIDLKLADSRGQPLMVVIDSVNRTVGPEVTLPADDLTSLRVYASSPELDPERAYKGFVSIRVLSARFEGEGGKTDSTSSLLLRKELPLPSAKVIVSSFLTSTFTVVLIAAGVTGIVLLLASPQCATQEILSGSIDWSLSESVLTNSAAATGILNMLLTLAGPTIPFQLVDRDEYTRMTIVYSALLLAAPLLFKLWSTSRPTRTRMSTVLPTMLVLIASLGQLSLAATFVYDCYLIGILGCAPATTLIAVLLTLFVLVDCAAVRGPNVDSAAAAAPENRGGRAVDSGWLMP